MGLFFSQIFTFIFIVGDVLNRFWFRKKKSESPINLNKTIYRIDAIRVQKFI
jgi:hypothetical protein